MAWLAGCGDADRDAPHDAAADAPQAHEAGVDALGEAAPDASPCGDGVCDFASETDANCPQDCGCAAIACAVDVAAPGGCLCDVCCADPVLMDCCDDADTACGITAIPCGNGACDIDCEDSSDCSTDCSCGDGVCDFSEDSCACITDCCGDGFCDVCEDPTNCPADC